MSGRHEARQDSFLKMAAGLSILLAVLLALATTNGCGMNPATAPDVSGGGTPAPATGPQVMKVTASGAVTFVDMPSALMASTPGPGGGTWLYDPSRELKVSAEIDGAKGGRLICGKYVLTLPAGVFNGVGTVTMTLPDSTLMLCDLDVAPAELNAFLKPVDLALHVTGTDADLDSLQMYWWDPGSQSWVNMNCVRTATMEPVLVEEIGATPLEPIKGVQLDLSHFSRYATGKAGW